MIFSEDNTPTFEDLASIVNHCALRTFCKLFHKVCLLQAYVEVNLNTTTTACCE